MPKYRRKPVIMEDNQWFQNGDHPQDDCFTISDHRFLSEGKIVRYFNRPDVKGNAQCGYCALTFSHHGWIDTLEGGHIVCPGDWIITGGKGEHWPVKPDIFKATYEKVEE